MRGALQAGAQQPWGGEMAQIRTGRNPGDARRTPVGWIVGLIIVAIATFAIIWWVQRGAPGAGVTGQEGVEERVERGQPGAQPGTGSE
jgi:hypothetical protein